MTPKSALANNKLARMCLAYMKLNHNEVYQILRRKAFADYDYHPRATELDRLYENGVILPKKTEEARENT